MAFGNFEPHRPALVLLSGLPAAGKTTFARLLARQYRFTHVESDAIRRSLCPQPDYSPRESARVFALVERRCREALRRRGRAVVDATNLTRGDRRRFLRLARDLDATLVAVRLTIPDDVAHARLALPRDGHSQADGRVFALMRGRPQPFAIPVLVVDSRYDLTPSVAAVARLAGVAE